MNSNLIKYIFEIILSSIGSLTLIGVLGYLCRNWFKERLKNSIKHEYDVKLEKIKSELSYENQLSFEKIKNENEKNRLLIGQQLEMAKLEYQIKNAGIYQKRMEAILSLHEVLIKVYSSMIKYTSIFETDNSDSKSELRKIAGNQVEDFWNIYNPIRILFPEELDKQITRFIHESVNKGLDFMGEVENQKINNETRDKWTKIDQEMHNLWDSLLASIREEFRKILGVIPDNNQLPIENQEG